MLPDNVPDLIDEVDLPAHYGAFPIGAAKATSVNGRVCVFGNDGVSGLDLVHLTFARKSSSDTPAFEMSARKVPLATSS